MLGLCSLHLLVHAITEYHNVKAWYAVMSCNNKRALELSLHHKRRIQPSTKCKDIRRRFRATKQTYTRYFQYAHIYDHMDKYLSWTQLSLMQQLNCVCNTLAKRVVMTTLIKGYHDRLTQLLPCKDVTLIVWGSKITGDISGPLRFHTSKTTARTYLQQRKKNKWTNKQFDEVDWDHLDSAMKSKANMYKIWWSKQASGFCGTQAQVRIYLGDKYPDKQCPNCSARETDAHLMLCPDKDRTHLLIDKADKLTKWLKTDGRTDPELIKRFQKYILIRNDKPF
jgi:hypothetical protein